MDYESYPLVQQDLEGEIDYVVIEPGMAKLIFKLDFITKSEEIKYSEECQDFIYDYLIVYMKTILRAMAEQKRKFKVFGCPLLIGMKPEPCIKPWEMKILNYKLSKELFESIQENDKLEEELESKTAIIKLLKKMDEKTEELSKTRGGKNKGGKNKSDDTKDDKTKDGQQGQSEESDEEIQQENKIDENDDILHSHVKERVKSELVYGRYTIKDLLNLLEQNPFIIPKCSIRHSLITSAAKKVKAKPTNIIF